MVSECLEQLALAGDKLLRIGFLLVKSSRGLQTQTALFFISKEALVPGHGHTAGPSLGGVQ